MSGDPELWNYRTGAEARQPLRKQSWNIPSALAAASALTLAASALSSRRQTWRQNDSIKLDLTEKNRSTVSRKDFWKLNSCPGLGAAIEGCVTYVWKRPGRSQQNCNVATRFLITEAKRGEKKKLVCPLSDGTILTAIFLVKKKPVSRFVGCSSSLLPPRQICCVSVDFLQREKHAVSILQSLQTNVFSGLWRESAPAQRRSKRWALAGQIFVPLQTQKA